MAFLIVAKDGSSFAKRISCLKIEPKAQFFLHYKPIWLIVLKLQRKANFILTKVYEWTFKTELLVSSYEIFLSQYLIMKRL